MAAQPEIPKTIGRYEILSLVGRGGMGVLYKARDPRLEREVALKMMLVDFRSDPNALDRFHREAKAVARLQHRNVVTIHELGDVDATPYIVMELLSGGDLDAILRHAQPMTVERKLDVVIQLCEGLSYAHGQGIVHRDIKPSNVRVLDDGSVKILDFGIARFVNNTLTQSGTIMGTPSYMAPEQILGQPLDGRADLFSTGVLLYELLGGRKPFEGESPTSVAYQIVNVEPPALRTVAPELPEALSHVIAHALRKKPEARYQHAEEMASDLRMIRKALDPLLVGVAGSADSKSGTSKITLGPLHATSGFANEPTVEVKIRDTADQAAAAPKPAGGKTGLMVAAIAGLVALGAGGWFAYSRGLLGGSALEPTTRSAPTAEAGAHAIALSSTPAGARISVDGSDTANVTPATVTVAAGQTVEISLAGFQTMKTTFAADDIAAGKKDFKLSKEMQPVKLTAAWSDPFQIVQVSQGTSKVLSPSKTDHSLTIQPGGDQIIARNTELLLSYTLPIDFQKAETRIVIPAPGTITVFSTNDTCEVKVDRQSLGNPPIAKRRIAAASHTVAISCPDGKQDTRRVTVESGKDAEVRFRW